MDSCGPYSPDAGDDDAFLEFVDYARSMLSSPDGGGDSDDGDGGGRDTSAAPWSWVVSRILKTCIAYSSGVTPAIVVSDLFQTWSEQRRYFMSKKMREWTIPLKRRNKRRKLPHTVTIDSIFEKNFLSTSSIIEAIVVDVYLLPGTDIYMVSLGDLWSSCTIDLYLHRRFYHLVEFQILRKGREIFLTGCCLRTGIEGSGHSRLLPTEYLVVVLDEDQDEDAVLLGAQFCSDSFASISHEAVQNGSSYSFYARIESVESVENCGIIKRKQIILVDDSDTKLKFLLWGEQTCLANLLSPGNMLALDKPYIAYFVDEKNMTSQELCLEYGSATQIYMVPYVQQEEQVSLTSTPVKTQLSRLSRALNQSQGRKVSQVALPLDSQGSVDYRFYPFQSHIYELHDKITGVSLYGVLAYISKVNGDVFSATIEDTTGTIIVKLHFVSSWSLGRVASGHTVYISGLSCSKNKEKKLEALWFEKDAGSSLINISCLPSLLSSSCLHKLSSLSDIFKRNNTTHICHVCIGLIKYYDVSVVQSHVPCGHFAQKKSDEKFNCSFCNCCCNSEVIDNFLLKVTLTDGTGNIFAWCIGQAATELLQISPDEFVQLPKDEQVMYLGSLENEKFIVAIINSKRDASYSSTPSDLRDEPRYEITRAQKWE